MVLKLNTRLVLLVWIYSYSCEGYYLVNLCPYFVQGGTCESSCENEARHAWGIPLCLNSAGAKCCIPSDHPLLRVTTTPTTTTTTPEPPSLTLHSDSCGVSTSHSRVRRVVGGNRAPPGAWPWQVAIRVYTGQYVCGGVIISAKWILSAAHCFRGLEHEAGQLRVYVGDQTLSYGKHGRDKTKTIRRIIQHEDFRRNVATPVRDPDTGQQSTIYRHIHDIALLELDEPLVFSDRLRSVCLPDNTGGLTDEIMTTDNCWVYGWGERDDQTSGSVEQLREVRGSMLTHEICSEKWGTNFTQDIVCFSSHGRGPCAGDSGGGLTCHHSDGRSFLMGIISWGREDCVHEEQPSVQTRIEPYMDWINAHLSEGV